MKIALLSIVIIVLFATGSVASAQGPMTYESVVQVPGLDPNSQGTADYVRALYMLSITVAALLAVVKIIFGGVKWMLSDVVTDKSSAIKDIRGAVFGLLIVLAAVLILNTINPNLTKLNILQDAPSISGVTGNPISTDNSPGSGQTACQKDPSSSQCCLEKGGTVTATPDEIQGTIFGCSI